MLLANGAVLGHVASSLAHEPDGSALDGLGFAGANEDGIGRRHEPTTLAFLIQRGLYRGGATAWNEDQLPTSPVFVRLCWAHLFDHESCSSRTTTKAEQARVQSCVLGVGGGVSGGLRWVDVYSGIARRCRQYARRGGARDGGDGRLCHPACKWRPVSGESAAALLACGVQLQDFGRERVQHPLADGAVGDAAGSAGILLGPARVRGTDGDLFGVVG